MIILEPLGGLANRMRVIASGIWLKEKLKTELMVIWNENYELNCPYNLLFEDSKSFIVRSKARKYNYVKTSNQVSLKKKLSTGLFNKLIGIDFCLQENDISISLRSGKLDIYKAAKNHGTTYIQTCQEFGDNLPHLQSFKPILPISEKINGITKHFTEFTIGVHIRRMDNANSIKYSPTELFVTKMNSEMEAEEKTRFFLCTDDAEVEKTITDDFGEKVITIKKERSRETVQGIQDAVTDLFCLSKTNKILGSYWSSFAEVASSLNHINLEILKTQ